MLSKFFLDRPVFAWVIAIVIMLVGALAIYNLPISQYPPIAPPSIYIMSFYPGASAETVENSVTLVIEQMMTGLDKMLYLSATSDSSGSSRIELTFAPGTDPDLAWSKVQNKLQLAMASWSLFCTWAQARSGSVPGAKVSSILPAPDASLLPDMYSSLSKPVIFCSMTWVTLFSTVSADAPG